MSIDNQNRPFAVDSQKLEKYFPTHRHQAKFWEMLGRTVATFGFLEETLARAIFALTATKEYQNNNERAEAFSKWEALLNKAITDVLGQQITDFEKASINNQNCKLNNVKELICDLRKAAKVRNALCHGSWRTPNTQGKSVPFFVNRKGEIFETGIDISFLKQTQQHTAELICSVMNTVTMAGYQFPGSNGPAFQSQTNNSPLNTQQH